MYTLATLYGVADADLTPFARLGSGSACRSLDGGFVHWQMGELPNGEDSVAVQLADADHWPEVRVLIVVVNEHQKKTSSTLGMGVTVNTSELYKYRIEHCVPDRVNAMKTAIASKDFQSFARATMMDSNQFHACCMDSYPPIRYMNDVSHKIVDLVHFYNQHHRTTKVRDVIFGGISSSIGIERLFRLPIRSTPDQTHVYIFWMST